MASVATQCSASPPRRLNINSRYMAKVLVVVVMVHTALGVMPCNAAQEGWLALLHALEEANRVAPGVDAHGIVSSVVSERAFKNTGAVDVVYQRVGARPYAHLDLIWLRLDYDDDDDGDDDHDGGSC